MNEVRHYGEVHIYVHYLHDQPPPEVAQGSGEPETDPLVEAKLVRHEASFALTNSRAVRDALLARGWTTLDASTPRAYIRMARAGVTIHLNSYSLVAVSARLYALASKLPGAVPRPSDGSVRFYHSGPDGDLDGTLAAADALVAEFGRL